LPEAPADLIPDDATPVNHLRRVFNQCFDARLPLLRDRFFMSTYRKPFDFLEVDAADNPLLTGGAGFDKM